jgi:DNA-binding MarR family transcriptional regulator
MARHEVDLDDAHESDLSYRVGLAWRELRRGAAMASLREHLFATPNGPLEPGQVDTLELIVQQPEWRMCDLAEALRVDPSTATRAVQRMVTLGLAERKPNRVDGRVVMVAATETGISCHAELVRNRRALMQHVMGSFAAEERIIFTDLLERFVDAVDTFVAELDPNPSG